MRPRTEYEAAKKLLGEGRTATETSRLLGIPRSTVRDWQRDRVRSSSRQREQCDGGCRALVDPPAYCYLLGLYLGDGCLSQHPKGSWRLRITLDSFYPGIIAECAAAIDAIAIGRKAAIWPRPGERATEVSLSWKHWPCLFPQHGKGKKHTRTITLERWQRALVERQSELFLRGLIHSDGCRIIATERKGSYVRHAPRYAFTNKSNDILNLFAEACDLVGVHYTHSSARQISIYSKAAVARLDEFIGPKR